MNLLNKPFGEIATTLGTAAKFFRPAAAQAVTGAAIGAGASYLSGDGSMGRDAALGAVGGFAYGLGAHKTFMSGAKTGGLSGGYSALKSNMSTGWRASAGTLF